MLYYIIQSLTFILSVLFLYFAKVNFILLRNIRKLVKFDRISVYIRDVNVIYDEKRRLI